MKDFPIFCNDIRDTSNPSIFSAVHVHKYYANLPKWNKYLTGTLGLRAEDDGAIVTI